jgi:hypothetical protein
MEKVTLGPQIEDSMHPQFAVPAGGWQGSRLKPGGAYALLGTTVAPRFEFADFELGARSELATAYPDFADSIGALTREASNG